MNRSTAALAVLAASVTLLAGCGSDASTTTDTTSSVESQPVQQAPADSLQQQRDNAQQTLANCTAAEQADIDLLNGLLNEERLELRDVYVVPAASGHARFISANIFDKNNGQRVSSADDWVIEEPNTPYALTGSARQYSSAPDGRDNVELGDADRKAANECAMAAIFAN